MECEFRGTPEETYYRAPSGQWWCVQSPDLAATHGRPVRVSAPPRKARPIKESLCYDLDVSECDEAEEVR